MIDERAEKIERMGAFFVGAQRMGYNLADAWSLMLNSEQGRGLLNGDYLYAIHHQGITTAMKADKAIGRRYKDRHVRKENIELMYLLAELIELAHDRFGMDYEDIFAKCNIDDFVENCGVGFGDYDDKLIQRYLIDGYEWSK